MAIKIFGHPGATCTQRVIITLKELDVPYEIEIVNLAKGEHKQESFLAKHPFGKVPYIEDDGDGKGPKVCLFESRAICKYLVARYGGEGSKLLPSVKDIEAYARFEEACSIEQNYFDPPNAGLVAQVMFGPMFGRPTNEDIVKTNMEAIDSALKAYDQILANRKYMAGDDFTLADLFHGPYGKLATQCGAKETFEKYPNVARWWKDINARDSFEALNVSFS
ncbi:hypothetical protein LIA77_00576 [Sarocladium implicatum]|nr:hypothetical protein LIA77_00576 [Sarocladium implicatum]